MSKLLIRRLNSLHHDFYAVNPKTIVMGVRYWKNYGGREILLTNKAQHCFLFDIEGMTVLKGTTMFQNAAQHFAIKPQNFAF